MMSLPAKDSRLPHIFYLRAERPIYRRGIVALALAAALLLIAVHARTERLIPLSRSGCYRLHAQPAWAGAPLGQRAAVEVARTRQSMASGRR